MKFHFEKIHQTGIEIDLTIFHCTRGVGCCTQGGLNKTPLATRTVCEQRAPPASVLVVCISSAIQSIWHPFATENQIVVRPCVCVCANAETSWWHFSRFSVCSILYCVLILVFFPSLFSSFCRADSRRDPYTGQLPWSHGQKDGHEGRGREEGGGH